MWLHYGYTVRRLPVWLQRMPDHPYGVYTSAREKVCFAKTLAEAKLNIKAHMTIGLLSGPRDLLPSLSELSKSVLF